MTKRGRCDSADDGTQLLAWSQYQNFDKRRKLFLTQRNIVDIDSAAFRSPSYDPMYAYSLWAHQRQVRLAPAST